MHQWVYGWRSQHRKCDPMPEPDIMRAVPAFGQHPKTGVISKQKRNECVKPGVPADWRTSIQNEAIKSISGILWATAPQIMAFSPVACRQKPLPYRHLKQYVWRESHSVKRTVYLLCAMNKGSLTSFIKISAMLSLNQRLMVVRR